MPRPIKFWLQLRESKRFFRAVMSKLLIKLCLLILVFCLLYLISPAVQGHEYDFPEQRLLERIQMVNTITGYRDPGTRVHDPQVLNALRKVPRHKFVPKKRRAYAYANAPVDIGYGQTISQPYIVALMTQLADIEPDMAVLEIGTGSGYQTALLSRLVDKVYSIERIELLYRKAKQRLSQLKYHNVLVRFADGYQGWPGEVQFDAIVVAAARLCSSSLLLCCDGIVCELFCVCCGKLFFGRELLLSVVARRDTVGCCPLSAGNFSARDRCCCFSRLRVLRYASLCWIAFARAFARV